MPNKKMAMTKLKRILQMLSEHCSLNEVCEQTHSSKKTVSAYKKLADGTKYSYQELLLMEDSKLETILQPPTKAVPVDPRKEKLDELMPEIIRRKSLKYANVQLIFNDYYRKVCPDGYGYTQFKKYVNAYVKANTFSYHNTYEPGMEWQIDFAGDALYLTDKVSGDTTPVVVLVCVMPYSQMPFLMALPNATTEWFFHGLNKGLEYLGALPAIAKSDNMKQWVKKTDRYCPELNEACAEWANYYGIGVTACRVRKPRDKGPVESAVNQLYKFVYSRIQEEKFHSLDSLNCRLWELLDQYNNRPYRDSSRWSIYLKEEKPQMAELPPKMHSFRFRKETTLGPTYHVCVGNEHHMYSVPYQYVGQKVKVMWDVNTVEVYVGSQLVCSHIRSTTRYGYSTNKDHMPEGHKAYERSKEYNAAAILEKAGFIGQGARWMVESLLNRTRFPQQAYGNCQAVLSLTHQYGTERVDKACLLIKNKTGHASLTVLANILKNNRDGMMDKSTTSTPPNSDVRGAAAYTSVFNDRKEGGV